MAKQLKKTQSAKKPSSNKKKKKFSETVQGKTNVIMGGMAGKAQKAMDKRRRTLEDI